MGEESLGALGRSEHLLVIFRGPPSGCLKKRLITKKKKPATTGFLLIQQITT